MFKHTIEAQEFLDGATVSGDDVAELLHARDLEVRVTSVESEHRGTQFIQTVVPGCVGRQGGGGAPTLGIIGQLGGIGARPAAIGLVSDAEGAIAALACALKLADMAERGDQLPGDVIITTHICPNAPIVPHDPVPFMASPVNMATANQHQVLPEMDAILSIDTTRGNVLVNRRGFAISPAAKEGYILKVSPDLLRIMSIVTGEAPLVLPITTQDITPYGNGVDHINSVMQPATATDAPVVAVALTSETTTPGSATGASQLVDVEAAARFCLEVAKAFGAGECRFYDAEEFARLQSLYGSMAHLQTLGGGA